MGFLGEIFDKLMGKDKNNRLQKDIEFENQVKREGYQYAGKRIAGIVNKKITSQDLAREFILEELDAARQGNQFAQNFVKNSGFNSFEYVGAINRTKWEGDESELEHIQLFLRSLLTKISDIDLMVKLSTTVVDEIMKEWELGKYKNNDNKLNPTIKNKKLVSIVKKKYNQPEGILAEINNDLNDSIGNDLLDSDNYEDKLLVMAYAYARRCAAAGLFLQGVFSREEYKHAKQIFQYLQVQTGHTIKFQEDAFSQALEYIQSYDNRITREFASSIVVVAESEETIPIYDLGQRITFERLIEMFLKDNSIPEEIPF
jgi:hypothetical protein